MYDFIGKTAAKGANPLVLVILTAVIMLYYILFSYLGLGRSSGGVGAAALVREHGEAGIAAGRRIGGPTCRDLRFRRVLPVQPEAPLPVARAVQALGMAAASLDESRFHRSLPPSLRSLPRPGTPLLALGAASLLCSTFHDPSMTIP